MALSILDGNQSATTLSTILSSGQHITAHTVVSLGTQAITDMRGAVSGSVVSISNFPATQPVSIASVTVGNSVTIGSLPAIFADPSGFQTVVAGIYDAEVNTIRTVLWIPQENGSDGEMLSQLNPLPISGTVTANLGSALPAGTNRIGVVTIGAGTVTIGAGTAQIGSVTASISNLDQITADIGNNAPPLGVQLGFLVSEENYQMVNPSYPLPISGTVTIGAGTAQIGSVTVGNATTSSAVFTKICGEIAGAGPNETIQIITDSQGMLYSRLAPASNLTADPVVYDPVAGNAYVSVRQTASVTIGSLPAISGTVTANAGGDFANSIENVNDVGNASRKIAVQLYDDNGGAVGVPNNPLPISGTVTANVFGLGQVTELPALIPVMNFADPIGDSSIGNIVPIQITNQNGTVDGNNPLPISGTVTANTFALQGTAVTTSNFTSTTASTVLAGYNATREVLTIFNEGAGNLHICAGATCTTIAYQVRLSAGDYYEVPNHQTTITHSAVFATAGTARVTEVS
jgi:hypothetical protein